MSERLKTIRDESNRGVSSKDKIFIRARCANDVWHTEERKTRLSNIEVSYFDMPSTSGRTRFLASPACVLSALPRHLCRLCPAQWLRASAVDVQRERTCFHDYRAPPKNCLFADKILQKLIFVKYNLFQKVYLKGI